MLLNGEKEQIESFLKFVKENKPEAAVVEEIRVKEYSGRVGDIERFRASFNANQLSKIIQIDLTMVGKRGLMLKKQNGALPIREVKVAVDEVKQEVREVKTAVEDGQEVREVKTAVEGFEAAVNSI